MSDLLKFTFLGLGSGGAYALLGLGVVLIYRGSGIVNFAHGGFALLGGAAFVEIRPSNGPYLALLAAVVLGAAAGAATQVAVMRPMRRTSPLARVVATLGILVVIQEAALHRYGSTVRFVEGFLPSGTVRPFGDVAFGQDRLWVAVITVALTGLLWLVYHRTLVGLATTALAENELATASLGWSPSVIATFNWVAGGALAGLAGALLIPIVGLTPSSLTLAVMPALAAALVGGFRSFPLTVAGGLLIGVLESQMTSFGSKHPQIGFFSTSGLASAVPFIAIIGLLTIRGTALPLRDHLAERLPRLGDARFSVRTTILVLVAAVGSLYLFSVSWAEAVTTAAVYGLVALSLVVVTGYCGQLSLAQMALAGMGALASSRAADVWDLPFPLALVFALVVTIPVGIVVALPAVRARGVNLAVATLGLAIIINSVILANPKYTGGVIRGTVISPPSLFGLRLDPQQHPERYATFCLICLAVGALLVGNLRRGAAGRGLIAIRSNERAAASLGINVAGGKLFAFALGAGLAALAGVLSAFRTSFVSFEKYNVFASVSAILQSVIGGIGFVSGGIAAGITAPDAVAVQLVNHVIDIGDWFALIAAVLLIALVIIHPDGIAEMAVHLKGLVLARVNRSKPSPPAPSSAAIGSASRGRPERVAPLALQLDSISVRFGSVMAVNDLSLRVEPGQVVGLIGPNGAGKTTVVDAVSGFVRYRGSVRLGDTALDGLTPAQRAGAGVVRSFQSLELFEDMTVEENLRTASEERSVGGSLRELVRPRRRELTDAAVACVEEFQLGAVLGSKPSALPYARRREVAIARAVALGPSVLLLDEPAAGLDSASRGELTHLIRRLADEWGIGVLLIEHDVAMVLGVCDQVTVINFGAELVSGSPSAVRRDQRVIDAYLGGSAVDSESLAAR